MSKFECKLIIGARQAPMTAAAAYFALRMAGVHLTSMALTSASMRVPSPPHTKRCGMSDSALPLIRRTSRNPKYE